MKRSNFFLSFTADSPPDEDFSWLFLGCISDFLPFVKCRLYMEAIHVYSKRRVLAYRKKVRIHS